MSEPLTIVGSPAELDVPELRTTQPRSAGTTTMAHALSELKSYELTSVRNALSILTLLREVDEVGVTDAARRLGLGLSTAHRLLATLKAQGYVRQAAGTRKYRLGPAMDGFRPDAAYGDYVDLAIDEIEWLRDRTQETVHLAVLSGTEVRFLAAAESPLLLRVGSKAGDTLPAHATAIGKVLLAALPAASLHRLYPNERLLGPTSRSCRTRQALERDLALVRRRGFARNTAEAEQGVSALAVAVREANGIPAMAVAVCAPQDRMPSMSSPMTAGAEEARVLRYMQLAVRRIEDALREDGRPSATGLRAVDSVDSRPPGHPLC